MYASLAIVATVATLSVAWAWDTARTPSLSWNSWNNFNCGIDSSILMAQAQAMVDTGLHAAGFDTVSSDDCWLLNSRDANGNLMPDPAKFPNGSINSTVAFIHSLGLKAGVYIARGHNTCAGRMGTCGHEAQDARWFADHLIDYLKDDDCGGCTDYLSDYGHMWAGLQATGRPITLAVEGQPDVRVITHGGYGNSKRVGHDITSDYISAVTLVDIASGLWPYAHNSSNATYGGWWNDLDMLEIGRGDFAGAAGLHLAQMHYSLWCIMKAPLILGNDLTQMDEYTLGVLLNRDAISVNQDALGIQGRRTSVHTPKDTSIVPAGGKDDVVVIAACNASSPTQKWTFMNSTASTPNLLYVVACDANDVNQQWDFAGASGASHSPLRNIGVNLCADSSGQADPSKLQPCSGASSQQWTLETATTHLSVSSPSNTCLDVFNYQGPDVEIYSCKAAGDPDDENQRWTYNAATKQIVSQDKQTYNGFTCLAATPGPAGGQFWTPGPAGAKWCLQHNFGDEGGWNVDVCDSSKNNQKIEATLKGPAPPPGGGPANYSLTNAGYNNGFGASGPHPHTRYMTGGGSDFTIDLTAATRPGGTTIQAADTLNIIDDDLVGNVKVGGRFCIDARNGGMLEVWTGPLTGGRFSAVLFNRSPSADNITLSWSDLRAWNAGVSDSAKFSVRDVWTAGEKGAFSGSYTATNVPSHGVAMLILTPSM